MFAYCGNNPVMYMDPTGYFFGDILDKLQTFAKKVVHFVEVTVEAVGLLINPTALDYDHDGNNFTTYAGESDMSVIARMLYGEDHDSTEAHMWILENRRIAGNYGGSDFRTLILADAQFSCMSGSRSLAPGVLLGDPGEREAWYKCVSTAYLYMLYGMSAFDLPCANFDYTFTHSYSDTFAARHPDGRRFGGTWFYNR